MSCLPQNNNTFGLPIIQTRAGMCGTCEHLPADDGDKSPCPHATYRGSLRHGITMEETTCLKGRWPDMWGLVSWAKRVWYGVPDLLRWKLLFKLGREGDLPGCACVVAYKDMRLGVWIGPWMRISGELRRKVAEAMAGWKQMREDMKWRQQCGM